MDEVKISEWVHYMPGLIQSPRTAACGRLIYEEDQFEEIIKTTIRASDVTCLGCLGALKGKERRDARIDEPEGVEEPSARVTD